MKEKFLIFMMQFIGTPYIWGGSDPKKGIDCSGLVQVLLDFFKLDPKGDQTADALMKYFKANGHTIDHRAVEAELGDLVFYGAGDHATHVAMALDDENEIEAGGGGHLCTTAAYALSIGAKVRINRIDHRSDLLCIIRPTISWV